MRLRSGRDSGPGEGGGLGTKSRDETACAASDGSRANAAASTGKDLES